MSDGYALLALAPQDWHGQWVGRQQLLSRIGKTRSILYSSGGWYVWDRLSDAWRQTPLAGRIACSDNVWLDESPKYLMRWPRVAALDRAVMRAQARRWQSWLRQRDARPLVVLICHPAFVPYLEWLDPAHVVYNAYDLYDHMPDWTDEWERLERGILRRADMVFCPSEMVAAALRDKVPREVRVLPNAADVESFFRAAASRAPEPADLAAVPHPRIAWTGSLHPQIDYGLIAALASRRRDWSFVLVGNKVARTEAQAEREYGECQAQPNVYFLGYKHRDDVPSYVVNMDVNVMCYRLSSISWIQVGYPLKLHEYLAAGRPIVSVDLDVLKAHSDVIRFATGVAAWEGAINDALTRGGTGTPQRRMEVARENSWEERAALLDQWIANLPARTDARARR